MISFTIDQLYLWINAFLWPFFRVLGLFMVAPLFSESSIPLQVKVGAAVLISLVIAPTLAPMPALPTASWEALWLALQQVLIGIALGFVMRIVFAIVMLAGEFIGFQMGLSFASFFDPGTGAQTAVISRLLNLVAMLVFLAVNGHLVMLNAFMHTFDIIPIAPSSLNPNGWGVLIEWTRELFLSGMLLALPLLIILLTMNLAFGILNRTAQQITIFAVGFPITLTTGLIILTIVIPQTAPFLMQLFEAGYETMARLVYAFQN
ncbi:MAG: flagellar biosynthetic protein FliR [Alcaligenaceae bacterium]|nr:flagellar biosynthetic protein FliR [Alcaligenaceae bacterium]